MGSSSIGLPLQVDGQTRSHRLGASVHSPKPFPGALKPMVTVWFNRSFWSCSGIVTMQPVHFYRAPTEMGKPPGKMPLPFTETIDPQRHRVYDAGALVTRWKQPLTKFPDHTDLPCRGCPHRDACYGPDSLASGRIVPFRFFRFS